MLSREWQLPNPEVQMRGRLKELWKPLLQITHGLTIYETLSNFVEEQKNERLATKQNTLEGHIVKVVTELYNQANENPDYIPFQTIWFALAGDLDGKIDDKKPHVMDTAEFFGVTKSKVGYRLREILSGKSKPVREKDLEGNNTVVKAYVFDYEKLRRIAKKYGYELVTKLPSLLSSEGVQTPISTLNNHENNVEKSLNAPLEVGKLSYSVTKEKNLVTKPKSIDEMFSNSKESTIVKVVLLKEPYKDTCASCEQRKVLYHQVEKANGEWGHVCQDCGEATKEKMER